MPVTNFLFWLIQIPFATPSTKSIDPVIVVVACHVYKKPPPLISVPYREPPRYNPKRRSAALGWLQRSPSASTLALPPSPCPSDRSSAPYSSASSSLSDASSGAPPGLETDTASIVTGTVYTVHYGLRLTGLSI